MTTTNDDVKKPVNVQLVCGERTSSIDVTSAYGLNVSRVQRVVLKLSQGNEVSFALTTKEVSVFVRGDELVVSPGCRFEVAAAAPVKS